MKQTTNAYHAARLLLFSMVLFVTLLIIGLPFSQRFSLIPIWDPLQRTPPNREPQPTNTHAPIVATPIISGHELEFDHRIKNPTEAPTQISIGSGHYTHPNGLFELSLDGVSGGNNETAVPLLGWTILQEDETSATLRHNSGDVYLVLQAINTGYELDPFARERLVNAREENLFSTHPGYFEIDRSTHQSTGIITETVTDIIISDFTTMTTTSVITTSVIYTNTDIVTKTLYGERGLEVVSTKYKQDGQIIFTLDLWVVQAIYHDNTSQLNEWINSVIFHPVAAYSLPIYSHLMNYQDPNHLIQVSTPSTWTKEILLDNQTFVTTFTSPDQHAAIQLLLYDDGELISKPVAGYFALLLLNNYMSTDIMVTVDRILINGNEELEWHSPRYIPTFEGVSSFGNLGTTYVMFTVTSDLPYKDIYTEILTLTKDSYIILCDSGCALIP